MQAPSYGCVSFAVTGIHQSVTAGSRFVMLPLAMAMSTWATDQGLSSPPSQIAFTSQPRRRAGCAWEPHLQAQQVGPYCLQIPLAC